MHNELFFDSLQKFWGFDISLPFTISKNQVIGVKQFL